MLVWLDDNAVVRRGSVVALLRVQDEPEQVEVCLTTGDKVYAACTMEQAMALLGWVSQ